jgi:hypothetical protein
MDQTVDVNARLHLVRYGGVYRIAGVVVVGLALGVGWVIEGAAHRKPVFVVLGIILLGFCVPLLIGAIRVWRASREVAAASQGRPSGGVGRPGAGNGAPAWRLLVALVIFAGLLVSGVVRSDHPIAGLIIALAALAMAVPLVPGLVRVLRRR